MSTPDAILLDLLIGDSTADSLSGRLGVPAEAITLMLQRHAIDGLVCSRGISAILIAWRITDAGRQVASYITPKKASPQ